MILDPADITTTTPGTTPGTTTTTNYNLPPNVTYHQHRGSGHRVENWLIVGTGPTAMEDWERILTFPLDFLLRSEIVLVNRAATPAGISRVQHHVTYHAEHFYIAPTQELRAIPRRHSNVAMPWTTDCWNIPNRYHVGGSAFLAAYIAGQLGVKCAILIGCPMEGAEEHTDLLQQVLEADLLVWKYYRALVKSMSGATREVFGAPSTI